MDRQGQRPALVRVMSLVRLGVEPGVPRARGGLLDGVDLAGEAAVAGDGDPLVLELDLQPHGQGFLHLAEHGHGLNPRPELRVQVLREVHPDAVPVDAQALEPGRRLHHLAEERFLGLERRLLERPAHPVEQPLWAPLQDDELRGVLGAAHVKPREEVPLGSRNKPRYRGVCLKIILAAR